MNSSSSQKMGGFGKIDITIEYGCCANQKSNSNNGKPPPGPTDPMARFHYPPPNPMGYPVMSKMPDYNGYMPMMYQPPPNQEAAYMGYVHSDDYKKFDEKQYPKPNTNDTKFETKRYYQPNDLNSNNKNNNNYHYQQTTTPTTTPRWSNYYTTQQPKSFTTNKRYNNYRNYEEPQKTTTKPTTPMDNRMGRNNNTSDYYNKPHFDSSPVLVAQEQFYTIENPTFLSTIPPVSQVTAINRGMPVNADRGYFFTSERMLPPPMGNMYGPSPPPPMPAMPGPGGRFYQTNSLEKPPGIAMTVNNESGASVSPPPGNMQSTPSYSFYGNHVTPRSILQDISKIVIQDVPSRLVYNGEQQNRAQRHQETYFPSQRSTTSAPTSFAPKQNYQQNFQQTTSSYQRPPNNFQIMTSQRRDTNYQQQQQQQQQPPQNNFQNSFANRNEDNFNNRNIFKPNPNSFVTNLMNSNNFQQSSNSFRPPNSNFNSGSNNYPNNNPTNGNFNSGGGIYPTNNPNNIQNNNNFEQSNFTSSTPALAITPPPFRKAQFDQNSNDPEDLIKKNRQNFLKMKRQAYDFFVKAALKDFREMLTKSIEDKNIEVLPEEKNMLDTKIEQTDEINSSILDYLTVYERYSDTLNNTELGNHILQDIDRAKEYLSMKLNKFWLELDAMEGSDEFMEKKNYYKNREKPSGIMNIFYEWYEKLVTNPSDINQDKIALHLVEIMKNERRYWLLLLRS